MIDKLAIDSSDGRLSIIAKLACYLLFAPFAIVFMGVMFVIILPIQTALEELPEIIEQFKRKGWMR